jgi:hypothetical protein
MTIRSLRDGALRSLAVVAFSLLAVVSAFAQSGTWTAVTPSSTPGPRREHGAIFDREHQRYILFDGRSATEWQSYLLFNDIWVLDVSGTPTWSSLPIIGAKPGERHSPQWGYDAARNRVLIFGGYGRHYPGSGSYAYLNDVWELSLNGTPHWTELFPSGQTPSGRLAGAAVYDPMRQRFVGFGGTINAPVDTWVLNLRGQANWQPLPIDGERPNGGWGMTSVYDAKGDRMLIFGGSTSDDYYGSNNDVWELKLRGVPRWTKLTTQGARPKPRRSGTAVFDALRNRMVIYGGFDAVPGSDQFLGDTWALDFDSDPPAWTQLAPDGTIPPGRDAMTAGYDPIHDRMILYGGWSGTDYLGDTRFLDWGGTSAEAVLLPDATATPSAAQLEWNVQAATGAYAAVYRRDTGGEWTALAEAEVGAGGTLAYEDATVQPGGEYSYMAVVGSERGETFGGETLVQVPTTTDVGPGLTGFALGRVAPNPATVRMAVSFTLPSSEPATLELLDVSGRRWLDREVGSLGAGAHRVELSTGGRVPPGLYFLRLAQGGRVASSRVAIAGAR